MPKFEDEVDVVGSKLPQLPPPDLLSTISTVHHGGQLEDEIRRNVCSERGATLMEMIDIPRPFSETENGRMVFAASVLERARAGEKTIDIAKEHRATVANAIERSEEAKDELDQLQYQVERREIDVERAADELAETREPFSSNWLETWRIAVPMVVMATGLAIEGAGTVATVVDMTGLLKYPSGAAPSSVWATTLLMSTIALFLVIGGTAAVTTVWDYLKPSGKTTALVGAAFAVVSFGTIAALRLTAGLESASASADAASLAIPALGLLAIPACIVVVKAAWDAFKLALAKRREREEETRKHVESRAALQHRLEQLDDELSELRSKHADAHERAEMGRDMQAKAEQALILARSLLRDEEEEIAERQRRARALFDHIHSLPRVRQEALMTSLYKVVREDDDGDEGTPKLRVPPSAAALLALFALVGIGGLGGCSRSAPTPAQELIVCDLTGGVPACSEELVRSSLADFAERSALLPGSSWRLVLVAGSAAETRVHTVTAPREVVGHVQLELETWRQATLETLPRDWFECDAACERSSRSDVIGALAVAGREAAALGAPVRLVVASDGWVISPEAAVNTEVRVPEADEVVARLESRGAMFNLGNVSNVTWCGADHRTTTARVNARDELLRGLLRAAEAPDFVILPSCDGVFPPLKTDLVRR